MIVMKFGGSSVGNAERIRRAAQIVKSHSGDKPVVVVSGIGGVTDKLIEAASSAAKGGSRQKLSAIIAWHNDIVKQLGLDAGIIGNELTELAAFGEEIEQSKALPHATLDKAMSFGERLSARIFAAYLNSTGAEAKAYDAYDLGMLTDSNFGNADILPVAFSKLRTAFRQISCIPVVTGFIGKDKEGNITTVGRGGSDYTACILGAALRADEIQIWTNVNGIMTADPKVIDDARNIESISYEEEAELEFLGSKTLHPKGIRPAMENSIPVRILNTMQPEQEGTLICRDIKEDRRIASITSKEEIEVICVKNQRKLLENGMLLKIIRVLERKGIWIDLILTSKSGVTMTLNQSNGADISAVAKELEQLGDVTVKTNMAKISLVGKSITSIEGISGRILSAVASIPIEAISVGGSETSESFIVRQEDAARAIRLLHTEFF